MTDPTPAYAPDQTPANAQQYLIRYAANQKVEGFGPDVKTHFPCPFCAAPDWMVQPITDGILGYPILQAPHQCKECKRTCRVILTKHNHHDIRFEFVQTGGDPQPEWLNPRMRVEEQG